MKSLLQQANRSMQLGNYAHALKLYFKVIQKNNKFSKILKPNILIASRRCRSILNVYKSSSRSNLSCNIRSVVFISPVGLESSLGYQIWLQAEALISRNVHCLIAVPDAFYTRTSYQKLIPNLPLLLEVIPYSLLHKYPKYVAALGSSGSNVIHALSMDSSVSSLIDRLQCVENLSLFIHLGNILPDYIDLHLTNSVQIKSTLLNLALPSDIKNLLPVTAGFTVPLSTMSSSEANVFQFLPLVDERLFFPRPKNSRVRSELGVAEHECLVVCPESALSASKNIVLNALDLLNKKGLRVVLLCVGKAGQSAGVYEPSSKFLRHLGWIERRKLPEILSAADILFYLDSKINTRAPALSAILVEFFAMGKPIVMSKSTLMDKIEHRKHAWLLGRDADAAEIAEALGRIAADKNLAQRLSLESVFFYRENFAPDASGQLLSFYERIVESQPSESNQGPKQ